MGRSPFLESLLVTPPPKGGKSLFFFLKGRKGKKKGDGIHYLGYKRTLELLCNFNNKITTTTTTPTI